MSAQQKTTKAGSTQKFTEIHEIFEDIVLFENGTASLVVEVIPSNFALLSKDEQDAKVFAYAALLNSLSFPIQIMMQSKKVDISSYIKRLEAEGTKTTNPLLASHINEYKNFVQELVRVNIVLDKKFYFVIPYSSLEKGASGAFKQDDFAAAAKQALHTKANSLLAQIDRIGLRSKVLQKEDLIKLFYSIYNEDIVQTQIEEATKAPIIQTLQQS